MASIYPTGLDSFANPTSTSTLDSPSHSGQHTDINDAVEAIEVKLGIGASPAGSASVGQMLTILGGGSATWSTLSSISNATITNALMVAPEESISIVASASSGTVNLDFSSAGVTFATANATANFTLNMRGGVATTLSSLVGVGQSISHIYLNTNAGTAYYPTNFQIDGTAQTIRWQAAGTPSSGNTNSIDAYAFTVIKTASTPTYTVLASQTRFA